MLKVMPSQTVGFRARPPSHWPCLHLFRHVHVHLHLSGYAGCGLMSLSNISVWSIRLVTQLPRAKRNQMYPNVQLLCSPGRQCHVQAPSRKPVFAQPRLSHQAHDFAMALVQIYKISLDRILFDPWDGQQTYQPCINHVSTMYQPCINHVSTRSSKTILDATWCTGENIKTS